MKNSLLMSQVREALQKVMRDNKVYSRQSFHSRAAITAAKSRVEDSVIKMLGRLKSSTYQFYINPPHPSQDG